MIFDEATAAVDVETEERFNRPYRTCHEQDDYNSASRLSTVKRADKIIVIHDGKIVETGNHDELVSYNGMYKQLCDIQFRNGE